MIETIGVLTSGGDAPGMNAAIRAVTRFALYSGLKVKGVMQGYAGLIKGDIRDLEAGSMANILQRGGTILKTGRSPEFHEEKFRAQAAQKLKDAKVDALVVIGGDGSFRGAHLLSKEHGFAVIGIPGTIDNDILGTDYTIGFDTAVNIALDAIDRIRDTAASHDRLFIVEVMGRTSGWIAASVGLAGGAEEIFFPGNPVGLDQAIEHIDRGIERGKKSSILVTSEGDKWGRSYEIAEEIKRTRGYDSKVCVLGHIQRGGAPTAIDRINASRLGAFAVEQLLKGESNKMVALQKDELCLVDLAPVLNQSRPVDLSLARLAQILSI